jgi:hypothetical protein
MGTPYNNAKLIFTNNTKYTLRFVGPFSSTNPDYSSSFPGAENLVTDVSGMSWKSYKKVNVNGNVVTETYLEILPNSVGTGINTKQKGMVPDCPDQDLLFTNILTKNQYTDCGFQPGDPTNDYLIQFIDNGVPVAPAAQVWIRQPNNNDQYLCNADGQYVFYGAEQGQQLFQISSSYHESTFYFTVWPCGSVEGNFPQFNGSCVNDKKCSGGSSSCFDSGISLDVSSCQALPKCANC